MERSKEFWWERRITTAELCNASAEINVIAQRGPVLDSKHSKPREPGDEMPGSMDVSAEAVALSSVTETAINGEMAAGTAAGSAALVGTVPIVPTSDDAAFTTALNGAGAGYLGAAAQHVAARTSYAGAQNLSSLTYVLNEVLSAASITGI